MTWSDPIVEEVHRIREQYAARFGDDMGAIFRDIRERIDRGEFQVVSRPPKPAKPRPVRRTGT